MLDRPARPVLLVGSVPLADTESVLRAAGTTVGHLLGRSPDGETGPARSLWVQCQIPFFLGHPQLRMVEADPRGDGRLRPARIPAGGIYSRAAAGAYLGRAQLRPGERLVFDDLGYSDWALESYSMFTRLKDEGVIGENVRFQVCLPSPLFGQMMAAVSEEAQVIADAYRDGLFREVQQIASVVPHHELAIQWDCTEPLFYLIGAEPDRQSMLRRLVGLSEAVPAGVELGYHLCFGDVQYRNGIVPNLKTTVEIANALCEGSAREITWLHMPVPEDRDDDEYFTPLTDLVVGEATRLFLGLVHLDGVEGNRARVEAASRTCEEFGIATECGFGRRSTEEIPRLLALHAEVARL